MVIADRQTQGRGRQGRTWQNAPGAVAVSVACEPRWNPDRWGLLSLLAGWQAATLLGDRVMLKWPNDLLVDGEKVGGVLLEGRGSVVVAGCGLNLWWPDPPSGMAGSDETAPGPGRREEIAHGWAGGFLRSALDPSGVGFSLNDYRRRCVTIGRQVSWGRDGRVGRAVGIDDRGALLVEDAQGRRALHSEEVFHIRGGDRLG